jgi:hypothetical protein
MMKQPRTNMPPLWVGLLSLAAALGSATACSVDEKSNPQRLDRSACLAANGKPITDKFCYLAAGKSGNGGNGGNGGSDAPADAGQAPDATPAEACKTEGMSELCYSGKDLDTALQPPCHAGSRKCEGGVWGLCKGDVVPRTEECNGEDDDCDGRTDEGEARVSEYCPVQNPSLKGACQTGISFCREGKVECIQRVFPASETCNDEDDDCDGKTDENTDTKCYDDAASGCIADGMGGYNCEGACASGTKACVKGTYAACAGSVTPKAEQCTTVGQQLVDENCDGKTDEGCSCDTGSYSCYTGSPQSSQDTRPCKAGTQVCSGGTLGSCMGEVIPTMETCANENKDDDCNGMMDDVAIRGTSCSDVSTGKGVCKTNAVWKCSAGKAVCTDGPAGTAEICDGQTDEDCDGSVDEGFNLQTDANNCGNCGTKCGAGNTCCAGACVNTKLSNAHCGGCGIQCPVGNSCCNSGCTNTKTDKNNCGMCAMTCLLGCSAGTCTLL